MLRKLISIYLILTVCTLLQAQKIPLKNYTIQSGLPQNTVFDIDQDFDGFIWFATQVGAARYDGYNFEYFNTTDGLPDDFVNCILVGKDGKIWLGTEGGIAVFDGSGFNTYTINEGLVDNRIDGLTEDANGNIWAATMYGISVLVGDTILSYTLEDALFSNYVIEIFADSRGGVHVAANPGLTVFKDPYNYNKYFEVEIIRDFIETVSGEFWYATQEHGIFVKGGDEERRLGYKEGLTDEIVLNLMEDHAGRIWCGTYVEGLFVYEGSGFRKVSTGKESSPVSLKIYEDQKQRIWILDGEEGVWIYDDGSFKHITVSNNLVHNDVTDIFEDRYGNIWLATLGGVSKYGRVIFEIIDTDFGLPENHITSVFRDSRDRIWFGTLGHLLYHDGGLIYRLDEREGFLTGAMPLSFAEDQNQNIYIGADKELLRYNGRSLMPLDLGLKMDFNQIFCLLFTPDQLLWCGTDSGIHIWNNGRVTILGEDEGLVNPQVNDMELMEDRICCATGGGITFFDFSGQHLASYTVADGLISDMCLDVTQDPEGNIWVATNRGISRLSPNEDTPISSYNTETGLSSNSTFFAEMSGQNALWIGTERGINVLNTESEAIEFYGYDDGFRPLETNKSAIARGSAGELWIGTIGGLVHYNPRYDLKDTVPPDLILFPPLVEGEIYDAKTYEKDHDPTGFPPEPSFPYKKNSLVFSYSGIHTTIPSQNSFSYILEGFDDDWSDPGIERSVSYRKLPNGHYVFKVKAYNLDGVSSQIEASFAFSIKPPFWKTIWFIAFEALMGLLLVYAFIKYRERQLIREKRVLESKVKERTREIEDQKVEIEAQRDEISDQKKYVEEQRDQIAFQNKEITDSILYAKRIQQAVLPGKQTLKRTLPDHFILFKPRDIVSGDYFWVEEKNERIIVCAADCTGHGVPGAFMSLLGLTFLNEIVNKDEILKAGEILNRLRSYIIKAMSHKHEEDQQARDGMDMSLVVIDKQLNMLEYAGAYNPLVIMRKGEMIEYKADKMPIGKHVGEEGPFTSHRIDLEDQDMIYLFSDGFADQFGGENDSKYKAKPFKRLLLRINAEPAAKQRELLELELKTWMGKLDQVDDILVMGIRYLL